MKRLRRRIDLRLVLGLVLVLVSALGAVGLVRAAGAGHPVLVATHLLVEGQHLTAEDVATVEVGSGLPGEYETTALSIVGRVVTRAIRAGELVPRASVGEPSETLETTLVIDLVSPAATSLREGSEVDIWAAPAKSSSSVTSTVSSSPRLLVSRARLAHRVDRSTSALSSAERVEVVVSRLDLPEVLGATAAGDALTVVASNGGVLS